MSLINQPQRLKAGNQTGVLIATLGTWNLRKTGEDRYKLASIDAITGKANYAFAVKNGKVDSHHSLDSVKLKQERPELFKSVEDYFTGRLGSTAPEEKEEEYDPYGQLARRRKQNLTPQQEWRRGLLHMRRQHLERAAEGKDSTWAAGVRALWWGNFKEKISDEDALAAIAYITQMTAKVNIDELLAMEREFYSGKFGPNGLAVLEDRLNQLANNVTEFENEEETDPFANFR